MAAVKAARHQVLEPHLKTAHVGIGSINSSMQCMMKEVCGQCLQKHRQSGDRRGDVHLLLLRPEPGAQYVDFKNLNERLKTNSVSEKLGNLSIGPAPGAREARSGVSPEPWRSGASIKREERGCSWSTTTPRSCGSCCRMLRRRGGTSSRRRGSAGGAAGAASRAGVPRPAPDLDLNLPGAGGARRSLAPCARAPCATCRCCC